MHRWSVGLGCVGGALAILALLVAAFAWWAVRWWERPLSVDAATILTLDSGSSVIAVADELGAAGILRHERLLPWAMRLRGESRFLQAGEYRVVPGQSIGELMARIVAGDVVRYPFRIPEGARIADVLTALGNEAKLKGDLDGALPETLANSLRLNVAAKGAESSHGEGWFFPDTYHYTAREGHRSVLLRAHAKMLAELDAVWERRVPALPYATPYELLIAASLIEKETGRAGDRAHVSQVLVARLDKGMRLQIDPTVIYGLGDGFGGDLTHAHLRQPTPYNTYVHRGLPPTPIALPGRGALTAAAHPSGAPYLYFVARGDGSSKFSETLAEHNAAVRQLQMNKP